MIIPEKLKKNIIETFGAQGDLWLRKLPSLVEQSYELWALSPVQSISNLSFNFVSIVNHKVYGDVILKISFPEERNNEILSSELKLPGYRRCLEINRTLNAVLLEYIKPGSTLNTLNDHEREWEITLKSLLNREPNIKSYNIPKHQEWCEKTFSKTESITGFTTYINQARSFIHNLSKKYKSCYINHGDFHYDNIIYDQRSDEWILIDPQPVYGYSFSDLGRFILNLMWRTECNREIINSALKWYSDKLVIDVLDLSRMVYIEMVLAYSWNLEGEADRPPIFEDLKNISATLVVE